MAEGIRLVGQEWNPYLQQYVKHFYVDDASYVEDLPECATSSDAIVIEEGHVYMVNSLGEWVKFGDDDDE